MRTSFDSPPLTYSINLMFVYISCLNYMSLVANTPEALCPFSVSQHIRYISGSHARLQ